MVKKTKSLGVVAIAVCVALLSASAHGAIVGDIQVDLFGNDLFWYGGASVYDSELFLDEDNSSNPGKVMGQIRLMGAGSYDYEIRGGSIELTPCEFAGDTSYAGGPLNPKIARADFRAGVAKLTIMGSIWQVGETVTPEYPGGKILEADVLYDFEAEEMALPPNAINLQLQMKITGGELYNGLAAGWVMQRRTISDVSLVFCQQPDNTNGAVEDFLSDINYQTPGSVQIYPHPTIPEPLSLGLLGLGGLAMLRQRQ